MTDNLLKSPVPEEDARWLLWREYIGAYLRKHDTAEPVIAEICQKMHGHYMRSGMGEAAAPVTISVPQECISGVENAIVSVMEHGEAINRRLLNEILQLEVFIYHHLPNVSRPSSDASPQ